MFLSATQILMFEWKYNDQLAPGCAQAQHTLGNLHHRMLSMPDATQLAHSNAQPCKHIHALLRLVHVKLHSVSAR